MKKTLLYCAAGLLMLTGACTKDFVKTNTNPASFTNPEPEAVLSGVFKNTIDRFELTNIRTFWEYSHLIEPGGQRYNVGDDGTWTTLYINVLGNTRQLKKLYDGNTSYTNRMAITDIWECYVYSYLVGTYGPIPYSHAGETTSQDVEYDDENTIYTSLLSRLKADAAAIKVTGGDKYTTDPIYGGDMSKWIKFANSLRLRIALSVQINLPDLAASNAKELMSSEATLLSSEADDPKLSYGTASGSQSQYNVQLVQGSSFIGTGTPVMSDFAFTYFRSYKDPRVDAYFNKATTPFNITDTLVSTANGLHYIVSYPIPHLGAPKANTLLPSWSLTSPADPAGVVPFNGAQVPANYSTLQTAVTAQNKPFYIMTYGELLYLKAEAAQRGYGGSQTADQYYYASINASFAFWGLSSDSANAYLLRVPYNAGNWRNSIGSQKWLGLYMQGLQGWFERNRLNFELPGDAVSFVAPVAGSLDPNVSFLPYRITYPVSEANINRVNYTNAGRDIGGDSKGTKLWWMK